MSLHYPQSNGFAENGGGMQKDVDEGQRIRYRQVMMTYRTTPISNRQQNYSMANL